MGLFRNAMDLLRGRGGKARQEETAKLLNEQASTVEVPPVVPSGEPVVVSREVKREARPDPNKPGWGRAID